MISETRVRPAKPAEKPYKLTDSRGIYLPGHAGRWPLLALQLPIQRQTENLALGTYPDVPLAKARERLQEARQQLAEGIDPSVVKQATNNDFEAVARAWLSHWRIGRSERPDSIRQEPVSGSQPKLWFQPCACCKR